MLTRHTGRVVCCLILIVILNTPALSRVIYVDRNRTQDGDGSSWLTAKRTVGAGLGAAIKGDEVWVAAGAYTERVTLTPGVGLYGGFAGIETSKDMRNLSANSSILDGSKGGNVVMALRDCGSDTVLDGFTIRGGSTTKGGGVYCIGGSPVISHNIITGNAASEQGGAIYCSGGAPVISDNLISDNTALDYGGGLYCLNTSATIARNVIERNHATALAGRGGGMFCDAQSSINLNANRIIENTASLGGGVYCTSATSILANNCILTNSATNTTQGQGGGIYLQSSPLIANNTICGNIASSGGGIFCTVQAAPTIVNNIVALNSSGIIKSSSQTLQVSANCVYANTAYNYSGWQTDPTGSDGNISVDPKLVGLTHIQPDSLCMDGGDGRSVQPGWKDIDDQERIQGVSVDIGADEYRALQTAVSCIAQARQSENGREVAISGAAVSAAFSGFYYIESDDRSCGIRVEQPGHGVVMGSRIDVHGVMRTNPDGERYIEATAP